MGFSSQSRPAILLSAALSVALAATLACQSAQKTTFMPPAQAQAPALVKAGPPDPPKSQSAAAAPAPQSTSQTSQPLDPVADLIAHVETEYQSGQDNYQAGHLPAAKQNFDSAFNLLLGGGFDLHSDDRLEQELDRMIDGTSSLDFSALEPGDSVAQKSEPAPIDETNEVNPTVDQKVKAKAEAEIKHTHSDLPLMMTDPVAGYINYFSNRGRGVIERALARSGRYEDMIRRTLQQEGVPQDLIYLAQAESGFHPVAVSRAGARGMWQFMASRAQGYGLERNWWVDDRQDPEKATRAAAHHLKDLYNQFGDWYLAMAAYNSGPGTVQSAVKRTGYADFWELYRRNVLPKETRNYVPIILAVTIMAKNPAQYGLDTVVRDKPVPYDTVTINYPIDLRLVADCIDVSAEDLSDLNPSLLRMTTPATSNDREFELHLPAGTADKFQLAVASIPVDKRAWWRYHKVQPGETLASIARTYHISPKAIADENRLNDGLNNNAVTPESRLIIPVTANSQRDSSTYAHTSIHYKIRQGDTVESVAENFGVSAKMLRSWNHLKGSSLAGRKILYLHLPVTRGAAETQLAARHSSKSRRPATTETAALTRQSTEKKNSEKNNTEKKSTEKSGAAAIEASAEALSASSKETPTGVVHHKVKPGETLWSIANSYRTTVTALKHDNRNIAALRPGMILIVHNPR